MPKKLYRDETVQNIPDAVAKKHQRLRSPQQPSMAGHVFRHTNDAQPPARSRAIRLVSVDVGRVDVDVGRVDVGRVDFGQVGVVVGNDQQIQQQVHTQSWMYSWDSWCM